LIGLGNGFEGVNLRWIEGKVWKNEVFFIKVNRLESVGKVYESLWMIGVIEIIFF